MDAQKPKVALYVKRSFGDKMNASFDFIKENWKPLLKYSTYLILPLCLIQALNLNGFMGSIMGASMEQAATGDIATSPSWMNSSTFLLNYAGVVVLTMIGSLILTSLVYALIRLYGEREGRLQGITGNDLKPVFFRNMKRLFAMSVGIFVLVLVVLILIGVLIALSGYTAIVTVPLFIAFAVPLTMMTPIYAFEDITFFQALKKSYRLGFATWGGIFLMVLLMGIIANVLQTVVALPWYVAFVVKMFFTMSEAGNDATVSVGYSFLQYLLSVIMLFGAYLSAIFTFVGIAYQYGHASEVVDSVTVEEDIDNFDKL